MDRNEEKRQLDSDEYREMPSVHIDAEKLNDKTAKMNGKILCVLILFVVLIVVVGAGYSIIKNRESDNYQSKPVIQGSNKPIEKDTTRPEFIGFIDHIILNLNAVDVDFSHYYLAVDDGKQAIVEVDGTVDSSVEGDYPIVVTARDASGNETICDAVVQVVSDDTMVAGALEWTPMIDGSFPLSVDTRQRVDANVIMYYYGEVAQEIKDAIANLGLDVSAISTESSWRPQVQTSEIN